MEDTLFYIGIVCAVLAGGFLITAFAMFFGFKIPSLIKDRHGTLEQKQIEEIRSKNSSIVQQRSKVNVFEELEKKAKVRKGNTQSLNLGTTSSKKLTPQDFNNPGTTVLQSSSRAVNPDFIIEKNIMFVSTDEVI